MTKLKFHSQKSRDNSLGFFKNPLKISEFALQLLLLAFGLALADTKHQS
jgi:hypothetical protein